jgi:hypothetical protein
LSLSSRGLRTVALSQPERLPAPVLERVGDIPAFIVVHSFQAMM